MKASVKNIWRNVNRENMNLNSSEIFAHKPQGPYQ